LPDCAPTGSDEAVEGYGLDYSGRYEANGKQYVVYVVICPQPTEIKIELQFTDGAVYMTRDVKCGTSVYVPLGTKVATVYESSTERILVRKELPPEISDPPSIARWYVYLPNVSR